MQRFTELRVWRRSHAMVLEIYEVTDEFPYEERFGLVSQLRRAAVSVPCNIAEGSKRIRPADYARFLNMAESSAAEIQYLVILSRDLSFLSNDRAAILLARIQVIARMLHQLRARVVKES